MPTKTSIYDEPVALLISLPINGNNTANVQFLCHGKNTTENEVLFQFDNLADARLFFEYCYAVSLFRIGWAGRNVFCQDYFDTAIKLYPEMLIADYCNYYLEEHIGF